jgi:uncharacterized MnhB-related membrane protein
MEIKEIVKLLLLLLLILCAISVNLTKSLLQAAIIFMAYSSVMCLVWILLESPDLAITEAAVGAGVSGILFLVTLRKLRSTDDRKEDALSEARRQSEPKEEQEG